MSIENSNLFATLVKKFVGVYTNSTHHDEATDEKSGTSTTLVVEGLKVDICVNFFRCE